MNCSFNYSTLWTNCLFLRLCQYVIAKGHFMSLSTLKVLQFLISAIFEIILL